MCADRMSFLVRKWYHKVLQHTRALGNGCGRDRTEASLIEHHKACGEDLVSRFLREQIQGFRRQQPFWRQSWAN